MGRAIEWRYKHGDGEPFGRTCDICLQGAAPTKPPCLHVRSVYSSSGSRGGGLGGLTPLQRLFFLLVSI